MQRSLPEFGAQCKETPVARPLDHVWGEIKKAAFARTERRPPFEKTPHHAVCCQF